MKNPKIFLAVLVVLFLLSCATVQGQQRTVPTQFDPLWATYPIYRIDDKITRIAIIGSGPTIDEITSVLTKFFLEVKPDIKVIESGNLQAILAGKIIEYGTGLNPSDAQTLSRMLQIDHVLLFEVKESPYSNYKYGGRIYAKMSLKIVNTMTGEVIYHNIKEYGGNVQNPPGSPSIMELTPSQFESYLLVPCYLMMVYHLQFALGGTPIGIRFVRDSTDAKVFDVMKDSLADRAGIQKGDKIIELNGIKVQKQSDFTAIRRNIKEGDKRIFFEVERQGKILQFSTQSPRIPYRPKEEEKENSPKEDKKERSIGTPL